MQDLGAQAEGTPGEIVLLASNTCFVLSSRRIAHGELQVFGTYRHQGKDQGSVCSARRSCAKSRGTVCSPQSCCFSKGKEVRLVCKEPSEQVSCKRLICADTRLLL